MEKAEIRGYARELLATRAHFALGIYGDASVENAFCDLVENSIESGTERWEVKKRARALLIDFFSENFKIVPAAADDGRRVWEIERIADSKVVGWSLYPDVYAHLFKKRSRA